MTTEQKEAVALVKDFTKMDFNNPMGWTGYYDTELKELQQAIETVLNLIQKQEKEIEHWKNGFERELESNRENACELLKQDLIIRKKDKIMDLMAKAFKQDDVRSVEEIKQYFERESRR